MIGVFTRRSPTRGTTPLLRFLTAFAALLALAVAAPTAGAIVGGTDQTTDAFAAPLAFLTITDPSGTGRCTGHADLAHRRDDCRALRLRDDQARQPARRLQAVEIAVRVGSTQRLERRARHRRRESWRCCRSPTTAGTAAATTTTSRCSRSTARCRRQPAALAEQHPDAGKPLLIAGYGSTSTNDNTSPSALKEASSTPPIRSRAPRLGVVRPVLALLRAASTDPALPGGTSCYGDSGGPAFAYENTADNLVVEGIISYGSQHSCEYSRSYLVLVSSERGFIDRALATPRRRTGGSCATSRRRRRSRPSTASVNQRGVLSLRIDDDKSRHSRVGIVFYTHAGKRLSRAFRSVTTNQWVEFDLGRYSQALLGLRLRAGLRRDEEAVERRVRRRRHRVTGAQVDRKR